MPVVKKLTKQEVSSNKTTNVKEKSPRPWYYHFPLYRLYRYTIQIRKTLGLKFLLMMLSAFFCIKGVLFTLAFRTTLPFLRGLNYNGILYQKAEAVCFIPWSIKGAIGVLSDNIPLWGYRKLYYMVFAILIGIVSLIGLIILPYTGYQNSFILIACLFLGIHLEISVFDVLIEGRCAEVIGKLPKFGPKVIVFMQMFTSIGRFFGRITIGPICDSFGALPLFIVGVPFSAQALIPTLWNFHGEEKLPPKEKKPGNQSVGNFMPNNQPPDNKYVEEIMTECSDNHTELNIIQDHTEDSNRVDPRVNIICLDKNSNDGSIQNTNSCPKGTFKTGSVESLDRDSSDSTFEQCNGLNYFDVSSPSIYSIDSIIHTPYDQKSVNSSNISLFALLSAACGLGVVGIIFIGNIYLTFGYIASVIAIVIGSAIYLLPRDMSGSAVFFLLNHILHVNINGATDYFYTADEECVPGGPNFSYTYFMTYTAIMGTTASWIGIWIFQRYLKCWSCRKVFVLVTCACIFDAFIDFLLTSRFNVVIGIPDYLLFLFGDSFLWFMAHAIGDMAAVITAARFCPPGLESTVSATFAGLSFLGYTLSKVLGAELIQLADILPYNSGSCNFTNLPYLILICHCLLPVNVIILAMFLLPTTRLDSGTSEAPHMEDQHHTDMIEQQEKPIEDKTIPFSIEDTIGKRDLEGINKGQTKDSNFKIN